MTNARGISHQLPVALCALFALFAAFAVALSVATLAPEPAYAEIDAPSNAGKLEVKGGNLVSTKTGKQVMLRGVSTHGLAWYPKYVNNKCFKTLREDWGVNCVRLAMYTAEFGYCDGYSKKALERRIFKGVKYATANDMYVIIDWHILSDGDPNTYLKEAKKFFKKMSKKYHKKKNVIFEICNEPNGRGTWKRIKKYARRVIPAIRLHSKDQIILVGTPTWCTRVDVAATSPLGKRYRKNVMYTTHFYSNSHQELARKLVVKAKKKKLPIFVSEYGISTDTGNGELNESQAAQWMGLLESYKISSCAWSLCNKKESSAFIKSSYKKYSGFTYKNLTQSGRWIYDMLHEVNNQPFNDDEASENTEATDDTGDTGSTLGKDTDWSFVAASGVMAQEAASVADNGTAGNAGQASALVAGSIREQDDAAEE